MEAAFAHVDNRTFDDLNEARTLYSAPRAKDREEASLDLKLRLRGSPKGR